LDLTISRREWPGPVMLLEAVKRFNRRKVSLRKVVGYCITDICTGLTASVRRRNWGLLCVKSLYQQQNVFMHSHFLLYLSLGLAGG
jgi:hypothetical protein